MADLPRMPTVVAVRKAPDAVEIDLEIRPDLFWFQGHFPDFPILPGVVQLDWALDFARRSLRLDIPAARQFQVKYKSGVFPGDRLTLKLSHRAEKNRLSFEYVRGETICSSGQISLAP
jgi:3-hydroxymyristoyl/3-hydroxydecanoyl-(acyl carrier protein) dehydratases